MHLISQENFAPEIRASPLGFVKLDLLLSRSVSKNPSSRRSPSSKNSNLVRTETLCRKSNVFSSLKPLNTKAFDAQTTNDGATLLYTLVWSQEYKSRQDTLFSLSCKCDLFIQSLLFVFGFRLKEVSVAVKAFGSSVLKGIRAALLYLSWIDFRFRNKISLICLRLFE